MTQATQRRPLIGVERVAEMLSVPLSWVYRRTAKGHPDPLPAIKVGGLLRFDPDELEAWLERHRLEDRAEAWRD
jgi:excisionase family DNA binding protein